MTLSTNSNFRNNQNYTFSQKYKNNFYIYLYKKSAEGGDTIFNSKSNLKKQGYISLDYIDKFNYIDFFIKFIFINILLFFPGLGLIYLSYFYKDIGQFGFYLGLFFGFLGFILNLFLFFEKEYTNKLIKNKFNIFFDKNKIVYFYIGNGERRGSFYLHLINKK